MSHRSLSPSVHIRSSESPPGYLPPALTQYAEKLKSRFFPNPLCSPPSFPISVNNSTTLCPTSSQPGCHFQLLFASHTIPVVFFPLPFRNICLLSHFCYNYSSPAVSWQWLYGVLTLLLFPAPPHRSQSSLASAATHSVLPHRKHAQEPMGMGENRMVSLRHLRY